MSPRALPLPAFIRRPRADARRPGGDRVVVARPAALAALAAFLLVLAWAVGLTSYVVFRDEVLARLARHQQELGAAYEDRIAELRAELERTRTRALADQAVVERTVEALTKRQASLEQRHKLLAGFGERPGGTAPPARAAAPAGIVPISDTVILKPSLDREARLESRPVPPPRVPVAAARAAMPAHTQRLAAIGEGLDRLERAQAAALTAVEERAEQRAQRIRTVLAELGVGSNRLAGGEPPMGGPFVPLPAAGTFEAQAARIATTLGDLNRLESALGAVPLRRPMGRDAEVTSGFGTRLDPFVKRLALHAGIDFRGETGTAVRATAAGRVKEAGWQGGYGNLVEIDHGAGLSTLYAHLSAIEVAAGQAVAAGHVVGRVGSTGRSTGPHLHYETHIDGEAVDPQRFLRAGLRLGLIEAP